MKSKILFAMLVLFFSLSALTVAQTDDDDDESLPPQPGEPGADVTGDRDLDNRTATGFERYWEMEDTTPISDNDRNAIERRAESLLTDDFSRDNFIMSSADFNRARDERSDDLYVIELTEDAMDNESRVTVGDDEEDDRVTTAGRNAFQIADLTDNIDRIPEDRTIAVVADDDVGGIMSVAILRMMGYNAWYAEGVPVGMNDSDERT